MFIHQLFLLALTLISLCCYACHGRVYVGGNRSWHHYHHGKTTHMSRLTSRNNRLRLMPLSSTRPSTVVQTSLMHLLQQTRSSFIRGLSRLPSLSLRPSRYISPGAQRRHLPRPASRNRR